jgi:hypothetical protein
MTTWTRLGLAVMGLGLAGAPVVAQDDAPAGRVMAMARVRPERPDASDAAIARDQQTQLELIRSRAVVGRALERPEVAALVNEQDDPVGHVQRRLRAEFRGEMLKVWMTSGTPAEQAAVVDAVVQAYAERVPRERERRRIDLRNRRDEIARQIERLRDEESARLESAAQAGDADLYRLERPLLLERVHDGEKQLLALRLRAAEAELRGDEATIDRRVLAAQAKILEEEIATLRTRLATPEPRTNLGPLRDRIDDARKQLDQAETEIRDLDDPESDRIMIIQRAAVGVEK